MAESDILKLGARPLRLSELRRVYEGPVTVGIAAEALSTVREAHALTARLAAADAPAYGINTGFGCSRTRASHPRSAHSCSGTSFSRTAPASVRCSMTRSCVSPSY